MIIYYISYYGTDMHMLLSLMVLHMVGGAYVAVAVVVGVHVDYHKSPCASVLRMW